MAFDTTTADLFDAITEALTLPPAADSIETIRRTALEQDRFQAVRDAVTLARDSGDPCAGLDLLDRRIGQLPLTYAVAAVAG
ncbi:hypothetical protein GCM10007079_41460 [Nocardiopsis terrae]|uniref:Uncharacterized protein n=1 Tax=Nocardiopsis terrae TaxID=372655 RepID=A0ABR9HLZ6_9ACTN|nr:hypothetical protein [Nocardiopsis terrae]MBE1460036.1 hypothetical protein [Nocardiopsis terrae]GHC92805.1 hypothetical protein GCM10007079_41460 [Nocardiopsis terrae]